MAHVENGHSLSFNGEKNPVDMRLASEEEMPHFKGNRFVLGSQGTAAWKLG